MAARPALLGTSRLDESLPAAWPRPVRRAAWTAAAVVLALVPAFVAGPLPIGIAGVLAVAIGLLLALTPAFGALTLGAALLVATTVAESMLVPDAGRLLPALTLAIPLLAFAAASLRRPAVGLPGRAVIATAILFLVVMLLSVIASTASGLRPNYPLVLVVSSALGMLLGLVALPVVAARTGGRFVLLATIAILGPLLVLVSVVLAAVGPIPWQGTWMGAWLHAELTIFHQPTGIIFSRVTGPFARPAGAGTILAASAIAMLVIAPRLSGRRRGALLGVLFIVAVFLALALNRDSWLILAVAAAGITAVAWRRGRLDGPAVVTALVFGGLLVGLTLDVVGANIRPDAAVSQYGSAVAKTVNGPDDDAVQLRGGASLTGREYLWMASYKAIAERPILGWGLGTNQEVIGQRLAPEAKRFVGLTSDSLWLRTATETGILGLLSLVTFCVAAGVAILRRLWVRGPRAADDTAVAFGVMFFAFLVGATFETYQLGGLTFPSFELALCAGLALAVPAVSVASGRRPAEDPHHPEGFAPRPEAA